MERQQVQQHKDIVRQMQMDRLQLEKDAMGALQARVRQMIEHEFGTGLLDKHVFDLGDVLTESENKK